MKKNIFILALTVLPMASSFAMESALVERSNLDHLLDPSTEIDVDDMLPFLFLMEKEKAEQEA